MSSPHPARPLALVPARAGSLGLPGKNVARLLGRPVVSWVLDAAKGSALLSHVAVTTNDPEVAEIASAAEVELVERPAELASATCAIDPALRHAVRVLEERHGGEFHPIVWLQANVPTTEARRIDEALALFDRTGADSVQTVVAFSKPPQWAWALEGDRLTPFPGIYSYTVRRQDTRPAYHLDGSINVLDRSVLMRTEGEPGQAYFGVDRRALVLGREESVEIDDPHDLELAELVLARRGAPTR